jgi:hypothetical protein
VPGSREAGPTTVAAFGAPSVEGRAGGRASRAEIAALLGAIIQCRGRLPADHEIVILADGTILADDQHPLLAGIAEQTGAAIRCED